MQGTYGQSKNGNFTIIEEITIPHPYTITPRHITIAANYFCGRLGEDAIEKAEKEGARCGWTGCNLSFKQHEKGLLVACNIDIKAADNKMNEELHEYLLSIKEEAEKNGYYSLAFKKCY